MPSLRLLLIRVFPRLGSNTVRSTPSSSRDLASRSEIHSQSRRGAEFGRLDGENIVHERGYRVEFTPMDGQESAGNSGLQMADVHTQGGRAMERGNDVMI